jgi:hypothetical protein
MKKILSILSLCTLIALPAMSQNATAGLTYPRSNPQTLISGGTNNLPVVTTNTINRTIDCTSADTISIFVSAKPSLSNNCAISLVFDKSVSQTDTNYDTVSPIVIDFTGTTNTTSANTVSLATNIAVGAFSRLRLRTIGSKEGVAVLTNLTVQYGFKR